MSWEGYFQCICEQGHRFDRWSEDDQLCEICGSPSCWVNPVDETNGDAEGFIFEEDLRVFIQTDAPVPTYFIPSEQETKDRRSTIQVRRGKQFFVYCESGKKVPHPYPRCYGL